MQPAHRDTKHTVVVNGCRVPLSFNRRGVPQWLPEAAEAMVKARSTFTRYDVERVVRRECPQGKEWAIELMTTKLLVCMKRAGLIQHAGEGVWARVSPDTLPGVAVRAGRGGVGAPATVAVQSDEPSDEASTQRFVPARCAP